MDSIICQYDHAYLKELIKYNKILQHRNAALKKMREERMIDDGLLDILDDQLVEAGSNIFEKRKVFEKEMQGIVVNDYARISGNAENAGFEYSSQLIDKDFCALLKDNRRKDLDMQRSNVGIHKDDYLFSLNGLMLKRFGSQGQKKSYVFALKLSLLKLLFQHSDVKPILLLDDIFDRLDKDRMRQLLSLIFEEKTGHFFLTDTDKGRVIELLKELSCKFEVFNIKSGNLAEYEIFK
jgi:DNA replication and repair protein RecF